VAIFCTKVPPDIKKWRQINKKASHEKNDRSDLPFWKKKVLNLGDSIFYIYIFKELFCKLSLLYFTLYSVFFFITLFSFPFLTHFLICIFKKNTLSRYRKSWLIIQNSFATETCFKPIDNFGFRKLSS